MIRTFSAAGAAVFALMVALALFASAAAQSRGAFQADLEKAGFTVTVTPAEKVVATAIAPQRLAISKGGQTLTLDFYDYPSMAALRHDWDAQAGRAPATKIGTDAFVGAAVYWNENSVIVISGANERSPLAGEVANVYLGPGGAGGNEPGGSATVAPPRTGSAGPESPADSVAGLRWALGGLFAVALGCLVVSVWAAARGNRQ